MGSPKENPTPCEQHTNTSKIHVIYKILVTIQNNTSPFKMKFHLEATTKRLMYTYCPYGRPLNSLLHRQSFIDFRYCIYSELRNKERVGPWLNNSCLTESLQKVARNIKVHLITFWRKTRVGMKEEGNNSKVWYPFSSSRPAWIALCALNWWKLCYVICVENQRLMLSEKS